MQCLRRSLQQMGDALLEEPTETCSAALLRHGLRTRDEKLTARTVKKKVWLWHVQNRKQGTEGKLTGKFQYLIISFCKIPLQVKKKKKNGLRY